MKNYLTLSPPPDSLKKSGDLRFFKLQGDALAKTHKDILKDVPQEYARLLQAAMKQQQKEQQEMAQIWRRLSNIDNDILIHKMKDHDPAVAQLAILIAGKKRLPVEKECIALLKSTNPTIRQAARQTLVRLGRSVDFGPEPTATPQQIAASVRSWSSWADIQTEEPEEPAEQTETP